MCSLSSRFSFRFVWSFSLWGFLFVCLEYKFLLDCILLTYILSLWFLHHRCILLEKISWPDGLLSQFPCYYRQCMLDTAFRKVCRTSTPPSTVRTGHKPLSNYFSYGSGRPKAKAIISSSKKTEESKCVTCTVCPCNGKKLGRLFFPDDHKKWNKYHMAEKDKISTGVVCWFWLG